MPSFRSGLRGSQRYEHDFRNCPSEDWNDEGSLEERTDEYRRRGSSLPTQSSWVNLRILPSLRHSTTDPDICMKKNIPQDVIETDYLRESPSSSSNQIADETTEEPINNNQHSGKPTCQSEINEAKLIADTCRDLRKALLDGLDERIIPNWQQTNGAYTLLVNADLLDRVSLDIVRMSQREPSGLHGCRLRTRLERLKDDAILDLGSVRVSAEAEETFEIVLSLKERPKTAPGGKHRSPKNISSLLSTIFGFRRSRFQPVPVYVSEAYQLEKIRLHNHTNGPSNLDQCQTCS